MRTFKITKELLVQSDIHEIYEFISNTHIEYYEFLFLLGEPSTSIRYRDILGLNECLKNFIVKGQDNKLDSLIIAEEFINRNVLVLPWIVGSNLYIASIYYISDDGYVHSNGMCYKRFGLMDTKLALSKGVTIDGNISINRKSPKTR